jgi:hypothetical protein
MYLILVYGHEKAYRAATAKNLAGNYLEKPWRTQN